MRTIAATQRRSKSPPLEKDDRSKTSSFENMSPIAKSNSPLRRYSTPVRGRTGPSCTAETLGTTPPSALGSASMHSTALGDLTDKSAPSSSQSKRRKLSATTSERAQTLSPVQTPSNRKKKTRKRRVLSLQSKESKRSTIPQPKKVSAKRKGRSVAVPAQVKVVQINRPIAEVPNNKTSKSKSAATGASKKRSARGSKNKVGNEDLDFHFEDTDLENMPVARNDAKKKAADRPSKRRLTNKVKSVSVEKNEGRKTRSRMAR